MNDVPTPVGATEPTATQRSAARELYQFYVALQQSGFTEDQALTLASNLLVSSSQRPDERDG